MTLPNNYKSYVHRVGRTARAGAKGKSISLVGESERNMLKVSFKGSSDQSHFIFEIDVGKSRIRHRTTLKLKDEDRLKIISRQRHLNSESFLSGPTLSDIDFKNKMACD